jgi:glutamine synthetase
MNPEGIDEIRTNLNDVDFIQFFTTDLNGRLITLQLNPENLDTLIENGIGFDGSSVPGMGKVDNSDLLLFPIPDSLRIIELNGEKLGTFIGKILTDNNKISSFDPRAVLDNVLKKAEKVPGYKFLVGPEYEFFLLKDQDVNKGIHTDNAGYFHPGPIDKGEVVRKQIIKIFNSIGYNFEKSHHEVTNSQHEINFNCTSPIEAADRTVLFNYITKKVAEQFGYKATFMPKPFYGKNRNAFHIHISMQDLNGNNLFYQKNMEYNLSQLARYFIGGILKYSRETSIIMASTFNSYKAYVADAEAPISIGWGRNNRSSMVRIPIASSPENVRIELRSPDPAGNVYLQIALLIGMGINGIKEKIDCGKPDNGNNYNKNYNEKVKSKDFLPKCMFDAMIEAEKSTFLKGILGESIYKNLLEIKRTELEEFRTDITQKDYVNYLDI